MKRVEKPGVPLRSRSAGWFVPAPHAHDLGDGLESADLRQIFEFAAVRAG